MGSTRKFASTLLSGRWMPTALGCIFLGIAGLSGTEEMWFPGSIAILAMGAVILMASFLRLWLAVRSDLSTFHVLSSDRYVALTFCAAVPLLFGSLLLGTDTGLVSICILPSLFWAYCAQRFELPTASMIIALAVTASLALVVLLRQESLVNAFSSFVQGGIVGFIILCTFGMVIQLITRPTNSINRVSK